MGSRRVTRLGLPEETSNRLCARGLPTAADVLSRTDLELMAVLDLPLSQVKQARDHVSRAICPPFCTVLDLLSAAGPAQRLPTQLPALDSALGGGLPCGCITELVGPSGVGKSQMCLMLAVMATLPLELGGLGGRVVLFDSERKFSSSRLLEIARLRFPGLFAPKQEQLQLVERVTVIPPVSPQDLLTRLKSLQPMMVRDGVRLILLDSVAALVRTHPGQHPIGRQQQEEELGQLAVALKELAEGFGVPVVVTNQVSGTQGEEAPMLPPKARGMPAWGHKQTPGQGWRGQGARAGPGFLGPGDAEWVAALGVKWSHAVNVRLALHASSSMGPGMRSIHIVKAPMAPPFLTQYVVTSKGVEEVELTDEDDMDQFH